MDDIINSLNAKNEVCEKSASNKDQSKLSLEDDIKWKLKMILNHFPLINVAAQMKIYQRKITRSTTFIVEQTCLILKDTRQESQNQSVTKSYSVGFSHDAQLSRNK